MLPSQTLLNFANCPPEYVVAGVSAASLDPYETKKPGKFCRMKSFSTTTVLQTMPMLVSTDLRKGENLGQLCRVLDALIRVI